ncbi:ribosomal protein S18 acetylase RimI-like enzyme [Rhodococcus sp. 27YEA15]|uniref:GNAT family N-acetyltransferase n=1 Tax=Rhodococcus sp. 27YEA15 TaxID=3156259 RepID=UPI003C7ED975
MSAVEVRVIDVDTAGVHEILAFAVGSEDHDRLQRAYEQYRTSGFVLAAAYLEELVVGVVGFLPGQDRTELLHLATASEYRRRGVGKTLVEWLRGYSPGSDVVAETDRDAVAFYEATGFAVRPLGNKYPGVERFEVARTPIVNDGSGSPRPPARNA